MDDIWGFALLPAIALLFIWAIPKRDTRYEGFRLFSKGLFLFGLALQLLVLAKPLSYPYREYLSVFLYLMAMLGFGIMVMGASTHYRRMSASLKDPRLDVNPEYDYQSYESNYVLCPACQKAQVKLNSTPTSCPLCKELVSQDTDDAIIYCEKCKKTIREEDIRGDVCPFCSEGLE